MLLGASTRCNDCSSASVDPLLQRLRQHATVASSRCTGTRQRCDVMTDEYAGIMDHWSVRVFRLYSVILVRPGAVRSIVMSMFVCLSVCPHISKTTWPNSPSFLCMMLVLASPRRRCDTLSTSGFVDDVMFSHNGHLLQQTAAAVCRLLTTNHVTRPTIHSVILHLLHDLLSRSYVCHSV